MTRTIKLIILLFTVTVVVLSVSLLARVSNSSNDNKKLSIYITGLSDDTFKWFNETVFPAFKKENPGIELSIITGGWNEFDSTVANWMTKGDGPDIVYLGSEYAATYGKRLADISSYFTADDLKSFLPAALETATFEGKLRGMPILMSPRGLFYRKDLVKGGIDAFKAPKTFKDAVQFVKENTEVQDYSVTRMGFIDITNSLFDAQEFIAYIWSAGGELYKQDGSSAFDSKETSEALQFMYDRRHAILATEDIVPLTEVEGIPLASGKFISGIFPMWNVPPLTDQIWDNIAIEPYPAGENGKQLIQVFTDWLSVPEYSKNKQLAAKFLKFMTTKDMALELNKVAGYTPVRIDAWDQIRKGSKVWDRLIELAEEYGHGFSDIRASAELRPLITEQANLYLTGQQSLQEVQNRLKSAYDDILKKNGYLQ
jgi:multiple sugar transport system substrate-binding protein